jgi:hypothetical protein
MNAVQVVIVGFGGLALVATTIKVMIRMNRSERQIMERRMAEWRAAGSIPGDKPNFYAGQGGSSN